MTIHSGNDQNLSSGMSEEDYSLNAARTIPEPFGHLDQIPTGGFHDALYAVSGAGRTLDYFKKALVYGESRPVPEPLRGTPINVDLTRIPIEVLHGIIGTITEACELADLVLTCIYGGDDFDEINLKEELGDLKWYEDRICRRMGWSHGDVRATNIAKLFHRHKVDPNATGTSFDQTQGDHANRDLAGERDAIAGASEPGTPGEEVVPASRRMLEHAIEHSVNFHGYDAKLEMPDYAVAAKLAPEAFKWLKGETDVQIVEAMTPEERAKISAE